MIDRRPPARRAVPHAPASNLKDPLPELRRMFSPTEGQDPAEEWQIRVCLCGCPVGCTLAALKVRVCPDCTESLFPIEEQTRSVRVARVAA